jgi:hypothetical protein
LRGHGLLPLVLVVLGLVADSEAAAAQFSDPCDVECALVLGATSFAFASGVATAVGRVRGGYTTTGSGIVTWTSGFVIALGSGIALAGNGERQERAVYSAGIGVLAGSLVGLAAESLSGESTKATRFAAALVGAAAGALSFGIYGAATWDPDEPGAPVPVASFSLPVGF